MVSDTIRLVSIRFRSKGQGQVVRTLGFDTVVGNGLPQTVGPWVRYWHPAHEAIRS